MTDVMLKLGPIKFSVPELAYQSLKRDWQYLWPAQQRINEKPQLQYAGEGLQTIELSGVIYAAESVVVDAPLRVANEAAKGKPLLLVSGMGDVLGYWSVVKVGEVSTAFFKKGVPKKQQFTLSLAFYGDSNG